MECSVGTTYCLCDHLTMVYLNLPLRDLSVLKDDNVDIINTTALYIDTGNGYHQLYKCYHRIFVLKTKEIIFII